MGKMFLLEIVTPEKQLYNGLVEEILCQTEEGELGILNMHMPMVTALKKGNLRIKADSRWEEIPLETGIMEMTGEKAVIFTNEDP